MTNIIIEVFLECLSHYNSLNTYIICIYVIFTVNITYGQEDTALQKMNQISEATKLKWKYNPFRVTIEERRLVGWQDPYAFITRFWIGDNLSKSDLYPYSDYLNEASFFYTPTIATELTPIAFDYGRFKFRMGVGIAIDINMADFKGDYRPSYGAVHLMSDNIILDYFIDVFIDNIWKFRWTPMRHICQHLYADLTADPDLFDPDTADIINTGFNGMAFQLFYSYGWATFYGGLGFSYTGYGAYQTDFSIHIGTDLRVPIWGEINFISGFYVAAEKDTYREEQLTRWNPLISVGLGIEIDRITYGFKYSRIRSRQPYAQLIMEQRIGAEFTILY